ncbi:UvrD-helicase domain-containing protein [Christensenella tenuis]|uniref:DNA 3'-5' helicase n=1 Tax=Christensenella tenuis TaxID=2763033 RepID=A0ABR7EG02_9FIRM|nr:UvrD-helicase domain-containing protein [Christensenella tenuis]MBC5648675.1 UvrD-helicase domain-containing protein [Christensenella tenuis]
MFVADLHIHSKYSRATSKECVPEYLDLWARRKGIDLLGTGDFTHPAWREELKEKLIPAEEGLYRLKEEYRLADEVEGKPAPPRFVLSGEISSIYKQGGKVRKIHNVILLPSLEAAEKLAGKLELSFNLHSDGRPILGLPSRDLLEITLDICPEAIFIPAHIWTPHFSLFGAYSGFDAIEECFGDLTPHIHALETGLSSDPPMNWRLSALDGYAMVSNSDAHSPANLAREANLFNTEMSYPAIAVALENHDTDEFYGTLEFFPEEGKYHNDGHRNCKVCMTPEETIAAGGKCPVCGRRITVGVYHRVVELADRAAGYRPGAAKHFESIVPLPEVVASSMGLTPASKKVRAQYLELLRELGPELTILRETPLAEIERTAGVCIAEGIRRLRCGEVEIHPGYDGEYGKILVMDKSEVQTLSGQLSMFADEPKKKTEKHAPARAELPKTDEKPKEAAVAKTDGNPYGLNDEQWAAASAVEPAVAVLAGPGTGKTRTLVYRAAWLVEQCGVAPEHITAVTFTNKAANEMRERLEAYFNDKKTAKAMHIGTFHSLALGMLKEWNKSVTVIDGQEALAILSETLTACNCAMKPRDAMQAVSKIKNGAAGEIPQVVYDAYCARLRSLGVLDFDDLLTDTLEIFREGGAKCEAVFPRFGHLLVDEFQDVNPVQLGLIRAWGAKSKGIFVIGDPDQSIYGFRGSDAHCFERLKADRPVREIRLKKNYRSTPEIIGCALPVVRHSEPVLEAQRGSGVKTRLLTADSPFSEALFIAKEINAMVGGVDMLAAHAQHKKGADTAYGLSDIAVLYRTHRQAELIEECLVKEGIPYVVLGKDDTLADRRVRGALAFFRVLCDPKDSVSLGTCLRADSVTPAAAEKILDAYGREKKTVSSIVSVLKDVGETELAGRFETCAPLMRKATPAELLDLWLSGHGYGEEMPVCLKRLRNMAVFHLRMADFLAALTFGTEGDVKRSGQKAYTADAVTLMTLHAAKGLEFPAVFLCGVTDGLVPFRRKDGECSEQEERRLFYVGMTRAQDELIMLTNKAERSPFLADIPSRLLAEGPAHTRKKPAGKQLGFFTN